MQTTDDEELDDEELDDEELDDEELDDEELDDEELDDEELDDEEASAKTKAPAARRRAPSEADKRTTFQAGKAAFAAGQPETGHPANLHPGLVRDWGNGWRSAATEAT